MNNLFRVYLVFLVLICFQLPKAVLADQQTDVSSPKCKPQSPETPIFSNLDAPVNSRPLGNKNFSLTGTVGTLNQTTNTGVTLVYKPNLCEPLLFGIEQKVTQSSTGSLSQQTLLGTVYRNYSITIIQQNGNIGGQVSATTSW